MSANTQSRHARQRWGSGLAVGHRDLPPCTRATPSIRLVESDYTATRGRRWGLGVVADWGESPRAWLGNIGPSCASLLPRGASVSWHSDRPMEVVSPQEAFARQQKKRGVPRFSCRCPTSSRAFLHYPVRCRWRADRRAGANMRARCDAWCPRWLVAVDARWRRGARPLAQSKVRPFVVDFAFEIQLPYFSSPLKFTPPGRVGCSAPRRIR
jgi:hypothetical protein